MGKPRLGIVSYLAGRPCVEGLESDPRFVVTSNPPSLLVESLRKGELDAALVSSIEAFRRPNYRYIPGIGIASEREVRSVLLISTKELSETRSVALDPASRAGAALARVCLRELSPHSIQFVEAEFGKELEFYKTDAWVRIGDAALAEGWNLMKHPDGDFYIYDLAALWRKFTKLPFVFALWLVAPGARWTPDHTNALIEARERGLAARPVIARGGASKLQIPENVVYDYLTNACCYDISRPGMGDALVEFRRRAAALGLADDSLSLTPAD